MNHLIKVAGFQVPITGWFWVLADLRADSVAASAFRMASLRSDSYYAWRCAASAHPLLSRLCVHSISRTIFFTPPPVEAGARCRGRGRPG